MPILLCIGRLPWTSKQFGPPDHWTARLVPSPIVWQTPPSPQLMTCATGPLSNYGFPSVLSPWASCAMPIYTAVEQYLLGINPFCSLMIHEVKHLLCSGWSLTNPHCVLQELNCVIAPCVVTLSPCLQVYLMTRANWAIPCPWWRTCQWWLCLACFWFHWKFWIQQWCGVVTCCPRPLLWSWFKASPCSHVPNPD